MTEGTREIELQVGVEVWALELTQAQVTDLPTTWVTFSDGTTKKSIKDYFGAPEALKNLEKMVEAIAEQDDGWVKDSGNAQEAQ